jgi:circadian clock protein KaiC
MGFDAIAGGGLPRNRTSLILGGPGGGKTVFALQTLVNGARQFGEPGIFVAFEENSRRILANAASFGWNVPKLEKKQLFFFDAKMRPDVIKGRRIRPEWNARWNQGRGRRERSQTNRSMRSMCF